MSAIGNAYFAYIRFNMCRPTCCQTNSTVSLKHLYLPIQVNRDAYNEQTYNNILEAPDN